MSIKLCLHHLSPEHSITAAGRPLRSRLASPGNFMSVDLIVQDVAFGDWLLSLIMFSGSPCAACVCVSVPLVTWSYSIACEGVSCCGGADSWLCWRLHPPPLTPSLAPAVAAVAPLLVTPRPALAQLAGGGGPAPLRLYGIHRVLSVSVWRDGRGSARDVHGTCL